LCIGYDLAAELDAWRAAQRPISSERQAVVQLLRQALKEWREAQKREPEMRRPLPGGLGGAGSNPAAPTIS
jgi:hypothetical protein